MKRIILLLLVMLCMFSVVFAAGTRVITDTVKPDIIATFNETVSLINYELKYTPTGNSVMLTNTTKDNKTFILNPVDSLINGFYSFVVNAKDEIGNDKQFSQNIMINVNQTDIRYISPPLGISSVPVYDITIETTRPAKCKWDTDSTLNYTTMQDSFFDTGTDTNGNINGKTEHKIKNFDATTMNVDKLQALQFPPYAQITVACKDILNLTVKKTLYVGYDPTPPTVRIDSIIENPVTTYPPESTITVASENDPVACAASGTTFSTQNLRDIMSYGFLPKHRIVFSPPTIASNGTYNYGIICYNLAWASTQQIPAIIRVALRGPLSASIISPADYVWLGFSQFIVSTNKPATCYVSLDSGLSIPMVADAEGTMHTKQNTASTMTAGTHRVSVTCTSGTERPTLVQKTFVVDATAPSNPTINATACLKEKLTLYFSANDTESGILGYNYSVVGANVSINWTFTSSNKPEISNLKMILNEQYSVSAMSINRAGKESGITSLSPSFTFNPNITIACLEKDPPVLSYSIAKSPYSEGYSVTINCRDATGCDNSSIKYGFRSGNNCTADIYGIAFTIKQQEYVCYEAKDVIGNVAKGTWTIKPNATGTGCNSGLKDGDETDVDCGNGCAGCAVGRNCKLDADCADFYCVSGTCMQPLCNDNIKNGLESDVDCGGGLCSLCENGKDCISDSNCISNYCNQSTDTCAASSCTDKIKNGFETDVDCGGKSCDKCTGDKSCSIDDDCESGSCQYTRCTKEKETFEEWAVKYGIDPKDKDGDADKDGLTNYEEYLKGTDPTQADTDGDGYNDGAEVDADTDPLDPNDYPVSHLMRYLLLALAILILLFGVLMLYYFKADKQTSLNIIFIGLGALFFVLIDWLLFSIPKYLLVVVALAALGGTGYFGYVQRSSITSSLSGAPISVKKSVQQIEVQPQIPKKTEERPATKEELAATKQMIEMIRKEKEMREKKRQEVFSKFSTKDEGLKKIEQFKKITPVKKQFPSKIQKPEVKSERPEKPEEKTTIQKISEITKPSKSPIEELGKFGKSENVFSEMSRLKRKNEAFEKLSSLSKSKSEDVFKKLPSSKKNIEELSKLEKKKKGKESK